MEIYLDKHNFAEPASYAVEAANSFLPYWGSILQPHQKGAKQRAEIFQLAGAISSLVHPSLNHQLYFYNASSEMELRILQWVQTTLIRQLGKNHLFYYSKQPHLTDCMEDKLPQKEGVIDISALESQISPKTAVIFMPYADPLTGLIQPVEEMAQLCMQKKIHLHVDLSFSVGAVPFFCEEYPEVSFSFSSQMLHTPHDSGILFFPKDHEERFFQSDLDMALLASASCACKHGVLFQDQMALEKAHLRQEFEQSLSDIGIMPLNGSFRLPNVAIALFPSVHHEMLIYKLQQRDLFACISCKNLHLSQYAFLYEKPELTHTAVSFVLSRFTTKEMIKKAAQIIHEEVKQLERLSQGIVHVG